MSMKGCMISCPRAEEGRKEAGFAQPRAEKYPLKSNKRGNSLGGLRHHIKEFLIANVPHMSKGLSQSTTTPVRQMSFKYFTPSANIWRTFVSLQPPNNLRG